MKYTIKLVLIVNVISGNQSNGYQCLLCLRRFDVRYSLMRHIRVIHEQATQQACNDCGRRFAWKSAYLRHINITCPYKSKNN